MKAGEALKTMREVMLLQHKSRNTIKTYLHWTAKFIAYLQLQPAGRSREENVIAFLTHLAANEHVAASTQKQALCAVVYLFKFTLHPAAVRRAEPLRHPPAGGLIITH